MTASMKRELSTLERAQQLFIPPPSPPPALPALPSPVKNSQVPDLCAIKAIKYYFEAAKLHLQSGAAQDHAGSGYAL